MELISTINNEKKTKQKTTRISKFYDNKKYTDCTFIVEEKSYEIHKLVFAASSPVFEKMLFGKFSSDVIKLTDISIPVFENLLSFIYNETIEFTTVQNAWLTYCAAHKYLMDDMCQQVVVFIQDNLSISTLLLSFEYADMFQITSIKNHCLFNISNFIRGIFTVDYHMKISTWMDILWHYEYLKISNEDLVIKTLEWVREECKCSDLNENATNMVEFIKNSQLKNFFQIHYSNVDKEYVAKKLGNTEIYKCFLLLDTLPKIETTVKKNPIPWILHSVRRQVIKINERIGFTLGTEFTSSFLSKKRMMLFALIVNSENSGPTSYSEFRGEITIKIQDSSSDENKVNVTKITDKFCYDCSLYLPLDQLIILEPNVEYSCRITYSNLEYDELSVRNILLHYMSSEASYGKQSNVFTFFDSQGSVLRGLSVYPA